MKLRMIPGGEKFTSSDLQTENPNIWVSKFSVRRSKDGPRYEKTVEWDFTNCTREDLIRMAFYDLRVWVQGNLRNAGDAMVDNPSLWAKVDVKADRINAARQPVDPEMRFIRSAAAMGISEAEARAILAARKSEAPVETEPETEDETEQE